jgi:hypothetical protein
VAHGKLTVPSLSDDSISDPEFEFSVEIAEKTAENDEKTAENGEKTAENAEKTAENAEIDAKLLRKRLQEGFEKELENRGLALKTALLERK